MRASNKVFLNTGVLYGRMLITMGITLYSTRLVLSALGEVNYGIFNLIAGIILMLSFLNAAMTTSTQRFLSFYQGKNDLPKQKAVFSNSLILHIFIGLAIVAGLEIAGFFLFDGVLNIPLDRIAAAKAIYHFMSVTVFFTIVAVPFNGSLVAHENMVWVAVVNIVEAVLKLGVAVSLFYISFDKLIIYGILTAAISFVSFVLYAWYCLNKYEECSIRVFGVMDKDLIKELGSFAGWNLFGALCSVGRSQGLAIILNVFFGAVINATYGIANQVNSQLNFFSATLLRALNPQIMKSEGLGDRERMLRLSMMASKFGFFLLAFFAIPAIFEMTAILKVWLKHVPANAVIFCSLFLISSLIAQLSVGLQSAVQATGKIRVYQIVVGSVLLVSLPLAYLGLKFGFPAYSIVFSLVLTEIIAAVFRLFFLKKLADLSIRLYFLRVLNKTVVPVICSLAVCYVCVAYIRMPFRFIITSMTSAIVFILTIYFFGLCEDEREMVNRLYLKIQNKFKYDKAIS